MKEKTLIILNKTFKDGFGVVPFSILKNPKIPHYLKPLYILLLSYAWYDSECFPGQERLAQDLGLSVQSVNAQLKQLKKLRLIDWKRRGQGKTNIYFILEISDDLLPDLKSSLNQDLKSSLYKIDKEEVDKVNNRGKPLNSFSSLSEMLLKKAEKLKEEPPGKKMPDWMFLAFDYAEKLGINWDDEEVKKEKVKARWLSLFKRNYLNGKRGKLQRAYSFMVDYPKPLNSVEKIKLFFWRIAN